MNKIQNLQMQTKTIEVADKGRVVVAVNRTGIEDSQGDISMPGSFDKTLKNDLMRMKWLYNHDWTQLLGVPLEGAENKDGDIVMVGQLNMEKQLCRDVYTDYKLMADYGRTLEHSVGVVAKKRDTADKRKVHEWMMAEYSTLSFWGANPCTHLIDIKSDSPERVREAIAILEKALKQPEYSDLRLKDMDINLAILNKRLEGKNVVICPHCGQPVVYDEQQEYTFDNAVLDYASDYVRWTAESIVRAQVDALRPEIRAQVEQVLDAVKAYKLPLTEKTITALMHFVRCPHCWGKIYAAPIMEDPVTKGCDPEDDKEDEGKEDDDKKDPEEDNEDDDKKDKSFAAFISGITKKINN